MSTQFAAVRDQWLPEIEQEIARILSSDAAGAQWATAEMTAYQFETGGKRLRAIIPLYVYKVLGKNPRDGVRIGAAIEMIHNATLVHDDLQDGDELRRGRPTVWKKYSAAQAINCGDAMFYFAVRLLAALELEPKVAVRLIDRAAASTLNVIEGQAQEFIMKDEPSPNVARYLSVIRGKTSGLFALPVVGAMEALGMPAKLCALVERAAMDLGMLFQVQDDLLDVYGEKGRDRVATDVAEGKVSILVAHVNEHATAEDKRTLSEILHKPREKTSDADITRAIELFDKYDAKGMAIGLIRKIQRDIKEDQSLDECPEIRRVLIELGDIFLEPVHAIL